MERGSHAHGNSKGETSGRSNTHYRIIEKEEKEKLKKDKRVHGLRRKKKSNKYLSHRMFIFKKIIVRSALSFIRTYFAL